MTKTLTEQWREGTLQDGFYYIKKNLCGIKDIKTEELFSGEFCTVPNEYIEEVLAPVPSYDEYCNLVFQANKPKNPLSDVMMCYDTEREKKVVEPLRKKLAIATKSLKGVSLWANTGNGGEKAVKKVCEKALKEMEEE